MNYAYNVRQQNDEVSRIMMECARQNNLLQSYNTFNQNSYNNQMGRIFSANPILNQQVVQVRQEQVLDQMKNIEEIELVKKLQKQVINKEIDETEMLKQLIIMPIKIERKNDDVEPRYCFVESSWEQERITAWAKKTNQPYKNIIPQKDGENDVKGFDYKQKISKDEKEKLTIHKVTELDKNRRKFNKEHRIKKTNRKELNNENRVTYSSDNYTKHKKFFDYEHIYTFKIKHDSKSHDDLKFDRIKYHEEKQKEKEKNRVFKDKILEALEDDNMVDDSSSNKNNKSSKEEHTQDLEEDDDVSVDDLLKNILETQNIINEEQEEKNRTADEELELLLADENSNNNMEEETNIEQSNNNCMEEESNNNYVEESNNIIPEEDDYVSKLLKDAGIY